MSDLFDAEDPAPKPRAPRRSGLRDDPAVSGSVAEAPLPAAEPNPSEFERAEATAEVAREIVDEVAKTDAQQRLLNDAQRLALSQIVDYRVSKYHRGKIDAQEVRRVLLEIIANL